MSNAPTAQMLDDDDDEIVDLLEVVKPGKSASETAAAPEATVDFSADLDAMLGQMAEAEKALDAAAQAEGGPMPFPDPTPVDHAVDPHETLKMPSMDDLDNLLASLGADTVAPAPGEPEAEASAVSIPDIDALPIKGKIPSLPPASDFPNVPLDLDFPPLAPGGSASLESAMQAVPAAPAPVPADPAPVAAASPAPVVPAPVAAAPPAPVVPAPVVPAPVAAAPPAPVVPAPVVPAEDVLPEIHLTGAKINVPPTVTTDLPDIETLFSVNLPKPPQELPDMETLFGQDLPARDAAVPPAPPVPAPQTSPPSSASARYDEVDLNELDALLDDMLASAPASGPFPSQEAQAGEVAAASPSPDAASAFPLREEFGRMRDDLRQLKVELQERNALIARQQTRLMEQTAFIEELRTSLASLNANLDKSAAQAAARVIREELAALVRDL